MVLFGGQDDAGQDDSDTWTWNGTTWTQQTPATSPTARVLSSMVYDSTTSQLLMFGGRNNNADELNDTWTWTGTNWNRVTSANRPPVLYAASMAYDAASGQVILFGGSTGNGFLNETWAWNGTNWKELNPASSPSARDLSSMTYDATTEQIILFGGQDSNGDELNDTWSWNGTAWTQLIPTTNSPKVRVASVMSYDPATAQTVLFGGFNSGSDKYLSDTWNWNGTNWSQFRTSSVPPGRGYASLAYDAGTGQLVMFGGTGATTNLDDTWNYGGSGAPAFQSGNDLIIPSGSPFTFTVMVTGFPFPAITLASGSSLPTGVSLTDNGNGTATLAGMDDVAPGTYTFTMQAANGITPNATQAFSLSLTSPPAIVSPSSVTIVAGTSMTPFVITTSGNPVPVITATGELPTGVELVENHNGTATISGTPTAQSDGTYVLAIQAKNAVGRTTQSFSLVVT
jgi:Putative Ig domain/Galactose oxidase, central domain